ncbi:helix-turn-helix domain-containing protein [Candidatus Spongiihabitans sp.]|uniref:helix-turn-helix domain-containing protein n=1 Tax=Candidatus Spongiihabitans sp. TaxID=3101308 RepID=UPI003C6F4DA8
MSDTEQRLYRVACLGQLWEMASKHAQQRLKILGFFANHGAAATSDAFNVSRRTLYRWKQCAKPTATRQP